MILYVQLNRHRRPRGVDIVYFIVIIIRVSPPQTSFLFRKGSDPATTQPEGTSKYEQIVGHYIGNYYDWIIKGASHTLKATWLGFSCCSSSAAPPTTYGSFITSLKGCSLDSRYAFQVGGWRLIRSGFLQLIFNLRHLIWSVCCGSQPQQQRRRQQYRIRNEPRRNGFCTARQFGTREVNTEKGWRSEFITIRISILLAGPAARLLMVIIVITCQI